MTRIYISLLLLLCGAGMLQAQEQFAFRVRFTDKNMTTFSLSSPLQYLSQRALDRRSKYNIAVDSSDLPVVTSYVDSVLHQTQGVLHLRSRWENACVILLQDSADILNIQNIAFIKDIKPVGHYAGGLHQRPGNTTDEPVGEKPTDFDQNFYGGAWNQIHLCNGEYLHEQGYMGEGKLIAVIDVGFTGANTIAAFDSLFQQNRLMDTWNYILDTSYVFSYGAHGCQVLSCMASYMPQTHVGTAPKAMYALYATDDLNSEQAIEEDNFTSAAERADSLGADLITTSLGYNTFDNPNDSYAFSDLDGHTTVVAKAANAAASKGIMMIASAGNEGNTAWQHILTPGDADSAMTVGSVNALKQHSSSSGIGPNAAGVLKPNVSAMGVAASVVTPAGSVVTQTGTSYATPVLAGLTACLMQSAPSLHPMQLRSLIESVSDSFAAPTFHIGNGVPDFKKAYNLTAIPELSRVQDAFQIYPNPADNSVFISAKSYTGDLHYSVYDLQGRCALQGNTRTDKAVDISQLSEGIYFLKVNNGKVFQTGKLIVR